MGLFFCLKPHSQVLHPLGEGVVRFFPWDVCPVVLGEVHGDGGFEGFGKILRFLDVRENALIEDTQIVWTRDRRDRVPWFCYPVFGVRRLDREEVHGVAVTREDLASHLREVVAIALESFFLEFCEGEAEFLWNFTRGDKFNEILRTVISAEKFLKEGDAMRSGEPFCELFRIFLRLDQFIFGLSGLRIVHGISPELVPYIQPLQMPIARLSAAERIRGREPFILHGTSTILSGEVRFTAKISSLRVDVEKRLCCSVDRFLEGEEFAVGAAMEIESLTVVVLRVFSFGNREIHGPIRIDSTDGEDIIPARGAVGGPRAKAPEVHFLCRIFCRCFFG